MVSAVMYSKYFLHGATFVVDTTDRAVAYYSVSDLLNHMHGGTQQMIRQGHGANSPVFKLLLRRLMIGGGDDHNRRWLLPMIEKCENFLAGVLGKKGKGVLEYFELDSSNRDAGPELYSCTTMSKAFGCHGGIIATNRKMHENIERNSGVVRGSASPPPGMTAASAKAFEIVLREPQLRQKLASNIYRVRQGLNNMGFVVAINSPSPIICLQFKQHSSLKNLSHRLFNEAQIAVLEMETGYSSIPTGGALLFTVFSSHSGEQIQRLLDAFRHYA